MGKNIFTRAGWAGAAGLCLALSRCVAPEDSDTAAPVFGPAFTATAAEVRDFLAKGQGGAQAKLAFIDRTRQETVLCYLDFAEKSEYPAVHAIPAAAGAKVPVISPDGEWIAYAVGDGAEAGSGLGQRSSVYLVRMREDAKPLRIASDSACEPRFVQAARGRLEIVYTTLAPNFGWEGFGKTLKVAVDVSGAEPVAGAPEVVAGDGSYTGGLSWDGRYLCGGGGHVAMRDLSSGEGRPDTVSYQGIQSCNASISSSRLFTSTLMYLNTSGNHPGLNGGKPWTEWQALLIGGREGGLRKGFMPPASPKHSLETEPPSLANTKWHHSEWSSHPYFATATVNAERYFSNGSGYRNTAFQERIYLINLQDSAYLEILRPDRVAYHADTFAGFYWPYLWVEVPSGFQEDPDWLHPLP